MIRVSQNTLLRMSGLVWILAGGCVLKAGFHTWNYSMDLIFLKLALSQVVFFFFYLYIFKPTLRKNVRRIMGKGQKNCPFSFINTKGWLIMAIMITLGYFLRSFSNNEWSSATVTVLYIGIGLALIFSGWKSFKLSYAIRLIGPVSFDPPQEPIKEAPPLK